MYNEAGDAVRNGLMPDPEDLDVCVLRQASRAIVLGQPTHPHTRAQGEFEPGLVGSSGHRLMVCVREPSARQRLVGKSGEEEANRR